MADISKIKLPNGTTYNIKDENALPLTGGSVTGPVSFGDSVSIDEATVGDLIVNGSSSFVQGIKSNQIVPFMSKTYTNVIGTANNWANATFFFGSVKPNVWNEYWRIKYKIRVHVPGQTNYNQMADVMISGRAGDFKAYYSLNTIGAYYVCYYHELYRLKEAGFNAGYGHSIGVRFYSAYSPTDSNYKRTIEVEILETENCSFDFYNNCLKYSEIPGTGTTNYNTYTEMDFVTNGLQETGDANDVNYYNREYYSSRTTKNALYRYQFCVTDSTGQLIPINSVNNSVATNKTLMTDAFDPFGEIFQWVSTSTYAAGANVGNGYFYRQYLADLRYSFNCGGYDVDSTLTARLPLYLVVVPQGDGTVKLYSEPLSQALPTSDDGLLYIYLGRVYEDTKPYRVVLTFNHPVYWYKNGAVRPYIQDAQTVNGHTVNSNVPSGAKFTDTVTTVTTTGSGNAVTAITASNGALTITKGTTFLTSHQDISGKADKSATVSNVAYDSTNKKITKTINGTTSDVVTVATLKTALGYTASDVGALPSNTTYVSTITTTAGTHSAISSKSGAVSFNVPTKTSHLTNDSGFITASHTSTYSLPLAASGTRGGVQIGYSESGTNYAVKLSSEKMYVTVPWTDTKVTVGALQSGITYYPMLATGDGTATRQIDSTLVGLKYVSTAGTTSTVGTARLTLGNSIAPNTANNEQGVLRLYSGAKNNGSNSSPYIDILNNATLTRTITLPDATGTVALTSDIPTVPTKVSQLTNDSGFTSNTGTVTKVTAGTGLSIGTTAGGNFTTSGTINHTNSVTAQTTQAVYPIKIDAQGHISAYGSAVTSMPASDVSSWAKASSKPTYTASEVGAVPTSRTVNGKALSANITLSASDVSALPSSTSILSTSPTLSSTGLSVTSSRCQITSGGIYSFGNWRFVQLQLTIKASLSANNTWGLLSGMPLPATGHLCALAASVQQNYGNVSANVSSAGSLVVQTAGKALASGDVLMVTGWYIVAS